jgi:hypothetical protein
MRYLALTNHQEATMELLLKIELFLRKRGLNVSQVVLYDQGDSVEISNKNGVIIGKVYAK